MKNNKVLNFIDYKLELDCYRGIYRDIDFMKFILKVIIFKGMKMSIGVGKCYVILIFLFLCSFLIDVLDRINWV